MNINGPNLTYGVEPGPAAIERKVQHAAVAPATPKDKVEQIQIDPRTTNVVVEMERNNTLVFKFIDEKTGKVIQQFPSPQMLHQSQTVPTKEQD